MTDAKREALQKQVRALVHSEMHLLETYFTKRAMLMLDEVDRLLDAQQPDASARGDGTEDDDV